MARGHPGPTRRSPPGTEAAQSRARPTRAARCGRACVRYLADDDPPIISAHILLRFLSYGSRRAIWTPPALLRVRVTPGGVRSSGVHLWLTQHPPRAVKNNIGYRPAHLPRPSGHRAGRTTPVAYFWQAGAPLAPRGWAGTSGVCPWSQRTTDLGVETASCRCIACCHRIPICVAHWLCTEAHSLARSHGMRCARNSGCFGWTEVHRGTASGPGRCWGANATTPGRRG